MKEQERRMHIRQAHMHLRGAPAPGQKRMANGWPTCLPHEGVWSPGTAPGGAVLRPTRRTHTSTRCMAVVEA
eukprot:4798523-Prymnesium_polylepis.1